VVLTCDAVLFDLDGVLVDSNAIAERHLRAWAERRALDFARVASIHHGRPTVETVRLVAPELDAEAEARLIEGGEARDTEGLCTFAGAARLVSGLPPARWAIVTSGTRDTATMRLAYVGLPEPAVLITADDVRHGKPAPDPYRLAAERLGHAPARCVVVEDAPAGIVSARAAGARVIAVAATLPPSALTDADVVLAYLADLEVDVRPASLEVGWTTALHARDGAMYTGP
jgi:sugar-phosphatase